MWWVRRSAVLSLCAAVCSAHAGLSIKRVLLIPVDDRPATTQFAQMIGHLAGVEVVTPPDELLGHFVQPGKPEAITKWLAETLPSCDALVVNTDMIAYGGLIASRTDRTSYTLAIKRLRDFWQVRKQNPGIKVYGFSAMMRLAPTATRQNAAWRNQLARFVDVKERLKSTDTAPLRSTAANLKKQIPVGEIDRYYAVRDRDHRVQQELMRMTRLGAFDFFALGQDDAKPVGPHVPESKKLIELSKSLEIADRIIHAAGIDQLSNVLLSRALMRSETWTPKIRVVYADEAGRQKIAFYESETLDNSLRDQIIGSGADFAKPGESFDYSLYVNTPDPKAFALDAFLRSMKTEVDQGMPVAIADVNLGSSGTADPRLYDALTAEGRSSRVLAYAGWNTAGNTMGTTIPAANVYMLARRAGADPLQREVALRAFILHRLVNDFEYHKFVRPEAYAMIDKLPNASREETYGPALAKVDALVKTDLGNRLQNRFKEQLQGTRFFAGAKQYEVTSIRDVEIRLPWPRAYEVKLDFSIEVEPLSAAAQNVDFSQFPILPLGPGGEKY
ncbi:MAG: DUF4127 family protein [Armatimonadetes bacterium]|nr:DUF4127 family protein [Armatimonadota bacterium]